MIVRLDPEMFRKKVGQYSDRWYIDPLPGCDIAPAAPDWQAPSVSTLKKASGKDWTFAQMARAGDWIAAAQPDFSGMDATAIRDMLLDRSNDGLDLASARGTQIHTMFEIYADGGDPGAVELGAEAMHYRRAVLRCIEDLQPVVLHSEMVCLSRTHGYGGTGDAIWQLADGRLIKIDYKSRGKKHAAYIEEAWQIAAYARCDYAIRMGADGPERFILPKIDLGGILSITPAGYQIYPVDLDPAFDGFLALRALWQAKANGMKGAGISKPWANPKPTRDRWIRDRIETVKELGIHALVEHWPPGIEKPKKHPEPYTNDEIDQILVYLVKAEAAVDAPWPESDPEPPSTAEQPELSTEGNGEATGDLPEMPDEGDEMPRHLAVVQARYDALSKAQQDWIGGMVEACAQAGVPIRVAETPTARRIYLAQALILACEKPLTLDTFAACVAAASDPEPTVAAVKTDIGLFLGVLSWTQAETLRSLVQMAHARQPEQPADQISPAPGQGESEAIPTPKTKSTPTKPRASRKKATT